MHSKQVKTMNTRIKDLAELALKQSMLHNEVYRPEGYANSVSKEFADKFAQLIVKECAAAIRTDAMRFPAEDVCWTDAMAESANVALKHFGLES